jgi:hypothetical protein
MPLMASLQYRFDWPYQVIGIPLAPYARVGLNTTPWMLTRNGKLGETNQPDNGAHVGWHWAAGIALVLDVFDEQNMARVRQNGIFQHSYLFAEWRDLQLDAFGREGFKFANSTWMAGIWIDF